MQVIRYPAETCTIADPELRTLVQKTIRDLSEDYPYDPEVLGYFLIVETGDTLAAINEQIGFDILCNRWTGVRWDQPGHTQSWECLEEHAGYFELVYVIGQDGYGIEVFIPKTVDIPDLVQMCQRLAAPSPTAAV